MTTHTAEQTTDLAPLTSSTTTAAPSPTRGNGLRIAFIVKRFPNLSETFILNQVTGLLDLGHRVHIYATHRGKTEHAIDAITRYDLLRNVFYSPRASKGLLRGVSGALPAILRGLRDQPGVITSAVRKDPTLRLLFDVVPMLGRSGYDIIHAHFGPCGIQAVTYRDIGALQGKIITHFRGYDLGQWLANREDSSYANLFQRGDMFLAVSESLRRRALQLGCPPDKLHIQRSGIDTERFQYRGIRTNESETVRLLSVGRLTEKKGFDLAIRAVAQMLSRGHSLHYRIVGDGKMRQVLQRLIGELQIGESVQLLGSRTHEEVRGYLYDSEILLAPSMTARDGDVEGVPNVIKEAMAVGLPVLSTFHGGIPELIEDRMTGYLVREGDVNAIVHGLSELLRDRHRWQAMSRAGRRRVEQEYDRSVLNMELVRLYEDLLSSPAERAIPVT